jgi:urea ABC transporter ATP-binding protein UrtE
MLEVSGMRAGYGKTTVLHGLDLELGDAARVGILGRNGAGKSTLLRAIAGLIPLTGGTVHLAGEDLTKAPAHVRARKGLGYVPQGRQIFPALSVLDNLRVAAYGTRRKDIDALLGEVYDEFPVLAERRQQRGGSLSGGQQQMLAIGRALMTRPKVLLLDEPSEGIQPSIVEQIAEQIVALNHEHGIAVLLVEQNLQFTADAVEDTHILDKGEIVHTLPVAEFVRNTTLQSQYIGV